jgi:drug/metabolite transporter (DMT)-like permease
MADILTAIFLWSFQGPIIRFSGMPVQTLMFCSCLISVFIIGPGIWRSGRLRREVADRRAAYLPLIGVVNLVNTFSFFYAYKNTTIANSVLTHYTAPIFVAFLAPFFLKERLTARTAAAVAIAAAGLWIMLDTRPSQFISLVLNGDRASVGIFAGLVSGLAYALLIIAIRTMAKDFDAAVMTFVQNVTIIFMLLPFVVIPAGFMSSVWAFLVMGIIHSTIAPFLYMRGMKEVSAAKTAILGYLEPVSAILLGMAFLNENASYGTLAGGVMILFSGYITIKDK